MRGWALGAAVRGWALGAAVRGWALGAAVRGWALGAAVRGWALGAAVRGWALGAAVRGWARESGWRGLPVACALSLLASTAAADPLGDASRAYDAGDVAHARTLWLKLADGGNAEAAYQLGLLADLGQGSAESAQDAYRWFRRAGEGGNAKAEFNVAVMEDSGRGAAQNAADAAAWYGRAAARGNSRAQYDLGLLYSSGDGVPQNPDAARAWFELALAGGLPAAAEKLTRSEADTAAPDAVLLGVVPVAPGAYSAVGIGPDGSTEIVWSAPRQPMTVRYFVQVVTRDGGFEREVAGEYVAATAAVVHLDPSAHSYFWRVFTVSPAQRRYVVTPWTAFSLRGLA